MSLRLRRALFCSPPRRIPHARLLGVTCRTVHLAAFALLLGGHAFDVPAERLLPALWLTAGSGFGLVALEIAASARWLLEVRGVAVLAKLVLVVAVAVAWEHRVLLLLAVVVLAGLTSHMPGRVRHASIASAWRGVADFAGARAAVAGKGEQS